MISGRPVGVEDAALQQALIMLLIHPVLDHLGAHQSGIASNKSTGKGPGMGYGFIFTFHYIHYFPEELLILQVYLPLPVLLWPILDSVLNVLELPGLRLIH